MYVIVASENGSVGMDTAIDILKSGGSALDAVEAATRLVESNVDDHTVGVGGYPNIVGEVELDASIMEGTARQAGAVAAIVGYPHPISIARAIMNTMPHHVLLAGAGAAQFAEESGFERMTLLTPEADAVWKEQLSRIDLRAGLIEQTRAARDPEKMVGTVNFLARDAQGRIASAVSTSGWSFKYPGRVGDSPIIGAGNYCDDRFGACACTGLGEWAIRASAARMVVAGLEFGQDLDTSCLRVFRDLALVPLPERIDPAMSLVALTATGEHRAYSNAPDRRYVWASDRTSGYETEDRLLAL